MDVNREISKIVVRAAKRNGVARITNETVGEIIANDTYPDFDFVAEHYKIIEPYKGLIDFYKGFGYKAVNNYYKTGFTEDNENLKEIIQFFYGLAEPPTSQKAWELFNDAMKRLERKIKPYDKPIIVYRGIRRGTIGQNFFDGKCITSEKFPEEEIQKHRYCARSDLEPMRLLSNYSTDPNVKHYVYENLGFASFSSDINSAKSFAEFGDSPGYDTILIMVLPPGTKFILPVDTAKMTSGQEIYIDEEEELILFPLQNTFFLYKKIIVEDAPYTDLIGKALYSGTFVNELNPYRPPGMPQKRPLLIPPRILK